jgi:hypothetical protein
MVGDRQVGGYRPSTGTYMPRVGGGWGKACAPPIKVVVPAEKPMPVDRPASDAPVYYQQSYYYPQQRSYYYAAPQASYYAAPSADGCPSGG